MKVTVDGPQFYSRSGQRLTEHVPHLVKQFTWFEEQGILREGSILDGELAIVTHEQMCEDVAVPVTAFNSTMRVLGSLAPRGIELQEHFGKIQFIVYDFLQDGREDLTEQTWRIRRALLEKLFLARATDVRVSPVFETSARSAGYIYDFLTEKGVEGMVAKNVHGKYVPGGRPNRTWYKLKSSSTADVVVTGYKEGNGKFAGQVGAIKFSRFDELTGKLIFVGQCSGLTDAMRREVSENREEYLGRVIEVKFNELVGSKEFRSPRHPQFVCFRDDKKQEECLGEEFRA